MTHFKSLLYRGWDPVWIWRNFVWNAGKLKYETARISQRGQLSYLSPSGWLAALWYTATVVSTLLATAAAAGASPLGAAGILTRVLARLLWSAAALSLSRGHVTVSII